MASNDIVIARELDKFMDKLVDRIFLYSQQNLIRQGKVDTGTLLKTGNINRDFLKKEIVYPALYAESIEYGRSRGSMPPVEPLIKWASRKLGLKPKEARSAGWAIAMAIKQRGIQASPFLMPAIERAVSEI